MNDNKIVLDVDSTGLSNSHCNLKFRRVVIDGLSGSMGAAAAYGVAGHKYFDTVYKTNGHLGEANKRAIECFQSLPKDAPEEKKPWLADHKHLISTCYNVWSNHLENDKNFSPVIIPVKCYWCKGTGFAAEDYPCDKCNGQGITDGPATEITFRILIYEDEFIVVYLCGTIDTVGKISGGIYAIRDFKTTSAWDKKAYLEQYRLSKQLRIYTLACKLEARDHPESILGKIGATRMGGFIDGIFLKAKSNDVEFQRSEVFQYNDDDIWKLQDQIISYCQQISARIRTNNWDKEGILHGTCHTVFGEKLFPCQFAPLCANNDMVAKVLQDRYFKLKKYNPLAFNE